jgi:hypothetical protein
MAPGVWQAHLSNPLAGGDDEPVQIIGTQGRRIIGRLDLLAQELIVDAQPQRLFVGSNFYVPEEHRKTLMGVLLVMKSQELGHAAALGPSQQALPVYLKLKWSDLILQRHILLRRSRAVMEKLLHPAWLGRAIAPAADVALAGQRAWSRLFRAPGMSGLKARRIEAMPEEFDRVFAARTEPVQFHHSARWINWLLANTFKVDSRNRQALYLVEKEGEAVAYFMVKVRFHETATHRQFRNVLLGSIQDWMIFQPHAAELKHVVALAVAELLKIGVDAVELNLPAGQGGSWLRWMGFGRAGEVHFVYKAISGSALAKKEYASVDQWWCRPGDGDNFFI